MAGSAAPQVPLLLLGSGTGKTWDETQERSGWPARDAPVWTRHDPASGGDAGLLESGTGNKAAWQESVPRPMYSARDAAQREDRQNQMYGQDRAVAWRGGDAGRLNARKGAAVLRVTILVPPPALEATHGEFRWL